MDVVVVFDIGGPKLTLAELGNCSVNGVVDETLVELFGYCAGALTKSGWLSNGDRSCIEDGICLGCLIGCK